MTCGCTSRAAHPLPARSSVRSGAQRRPTRGAPEISILDRRRPATRPGNPLYRPRSVLAYPKGYKTRTVPNDSSRAVAGGGTGGRIRRTAGAAHAPTTTISCHTDRGGRDRGRKMLLTRRGLDMRDLHGGPCRVRPCARKAFDEGAAASRLGWLEHGYSVLALRQEDLG